MKAFLKFKAWIIKAFFNTKKELKTIIPIAIEIVNGIKKFVDSPGSNFLTAVIPGTLDDQVVTFLRASLPGILQGLHKWESIGGGEDVNIQLKLIAEEFKTLNKSERDNIKTQAATEIVTALATLADIEVSEKDAKIMTLTAYSYPELLNNETV